MNIKEILKPYYKQNKGGLDEWIDYNDALESIKEIVKETLRMAAEDAEITLQNDGFIDYRAISKDSITNVYNKIKF